MAVPRVKSKFWCLSLIGGVLLALSCTPESGRQGSTAQRPSATLAAPTQEEKAAQPVDVIVAPLASVAKAPAQQRDVHVPGVVAVPPSPRQPRQDEEIIPAQESLADADGRFRRERLVRRDFQYPLIRIEETIQRTPTGEQVIQRLEMVADHVLVSAAPGIDQVAMQKVAERHGVQVRSRVRGTHNYLLSFTAEDHQALARAKTALLGDAALRVVEPDYLVHHMVTPDDPQYGQLWGLHNQGQTGGTSDADIDAPEAWELGTGSLSVRVGVIDTGIDHTHPDLAANIWTNPGESGNDGSGNDKRTNGIDDDGNGYIDDWRGWDFVNNDNNPMDDHYHGTHCAGTIGAVGGNSAGITGVCWQVSLVGLKFLDAGGSGTTSAAIAAVTYATLIDLDLTSNSWGGGGFSQALKDAIDAAGAQDKLFVVAAGNSAGNNDLSPVYPANYTSDILIAVAATSHTDALASFSCYGATSVDLGAPGVDIHSTKPGNTYGLLSGTSMATPHVAGACALLKSLNPSLSGSQIKAALLAYADPTPALAGKVLSNGRLNLAAAAVSVSGPHLNAVATVLSDSPVVDGIISPGESVLVSVTLRNVGSETASGVTAELTTSDGFLTIVQSTSIYGDISAGTQAGPDQPGAVLVSAPLATPITATMALVVNGQDADGDPHTWTIPVTFTVATAATISGQVVRTTGGAPVSGATVTFSGPSPGSVVTAVDGTFSRVVIDGDHTLVASASDLSPSAPQVITTPPGQSNVVFSLGAPDITIDPTALTVVVGQGETATSQFTVANDGDQQLAAAFHVQTGTWETTGLWHQSSWRDYDGGQAWYYGNEVTRTYNTGSRNFGELTSLEIIVPTGTPVLTFWSWRVTESGLSWDRSLVQIKPQGSTVWTTVRQISDISGSWQRSDIDLLAYAGQVIQVRFSFDTIDSVLNDYEGWYIDAVTINGLAVDGWMVLDEDAVDLAPSAAQAIGVTVDPGARQPGTYQQNVVITSNDPDEAQVLLPVTMVVEGRPVLVLDSSYGHDDGTEFGIGDGDGATEPGETVLFLPVLLNQGAAAAADVTAVLSTSDPYISIPTATATYGTIIAGGGMMGSGFYVEIAANCPIDHQIQFTLVVQDGSNRQWTLSPTIDVVSRSQVSGVISDLATGLGIAGASVSAFPFATQTASDGSYEINGLPPGIWTVTVSAAGFTQQANAITVPGDATWNVALGAPQLQVTPPALSATLVLGETVTHQLTISNPGNAPLDWSVSLPYDANDYVIDTSDQVGGPAYVWNDIRTTGTAITGFYDDSNYGPFPLGFSFPFFDGTTSTVRVCSNGWLSPDSTSTSYSNQLLPSVYAPRPLIAFYWRDLYFYAGSTAHYQQVDAGTFVLQYTDVGLYGNSSLLLTCQVVLKSDGSITMYYQRVDSPTYGTVGIQNAAGTIGAVATHNQAFLHADLAVRFRPASAGITITPDAGTTAPDGSTIIDVVVDSAAYGVGLHEEVLTVTSNAPVGGVVQVPVTTLVTIGAAPVVEAQTVATDEDVQVGITVVATDDDGDPLTYAVTLQPTYGTLSGTLPDVLYQPAPQFYGTDSFTVVANDPYQQSAPAVITIEVQPVNDSPVAATLQPLRVTLGQPFSYTIPVDLFTDIEDGDIAPQTVCLYPNVPLPARFSYDPMSRVLSGTPIADDIDTLVFVLTATDSGGLSVSASLPAVVSVTPILDGKLLASDGADDHRFATAIALEGTRAVIGAPTAGGLGQVYLFEQVTGGWQQQVVLQPDPTGSPSLFGCAVDLEGDTLVIASALPLGARVTIYGLSAGTWLPQQTIDLTLAAKSVVSGVELDMDHVVALGLCGDILAIGTPFDASGSVRIFERSDGLWSQHYHLNGGSEFQRLGWSVGAIDGRVVVGAPRSRFGRTDAGAVIVLDHQSGAWGALELVLANDRQDGDLFGMSLDIDAHTLAVGAPGDDREGVDAGSLRVFRQENGYWGESEMLLPQSVGFMEAEAFGEHVDQVIATQPYNVVVTPMQPGGQLFACTANGINGSVSVVPWQSGGFGSATTFVVGGLMADLEKSDFNGDGFTDLVVVAQNVNVVKVLLGDGAGAFQAPLSFATPAIPQAVAVADFNHDGWMDLVTTSFSGWMSVLSGNGDGTFDARVDTLLPGPASRLAVADVDHDGHADVVISNYSSGTVSVLLGNGNGTFQPRTDFAAVVTPYAIAVGDLSGEGNPDIVVSDPSSNAMAVLFGDGAGGFSAPVSYPTGNYGYTVVIADIDGDGDGDVVVAVPNSGRFEVHLNDGSGSLTQRFDYAVPSSPLGLAVHDLTEDGFLDVVVGTATATIAAYPQQAGSLVGAHFGSAVALSGNRLVVGAEGNQPLLGGSLFGYLRPYIGVDFTRVMIHAPSDASLHARFGSAITMDNDRLLVAAVGDDDLGPLSGSAYAMRMNINRAPAISPASLVVTQDSSTAITMAAEDPDGDVFTIAIVGGSDHGTAVVSGTTLTYTPAPGFIGNDTIQVAANDGLLTSAVTTITVEVVPYPQLMVGSLLHAEGDSGTNLRTVTMVLSHASTSPITVAWATRDGSGHAGSDYVASAGTLTFAIGEIQTSFAVPVIGDTVVEHDEVVALEFSTTSQVILPSSEPAFIIDNDDANSAPVIAEGATVAVTCDEDNLPQAFALTLHASDPDVGQVVEWQVATAPGHGDVVLGAGSDVVVGYTPTADFNGSDSFELRAVDGFGGEATITVAVTIRPRNDAPVATVVPQITLVSVGNDSSDLHASTGTWNDDRDVAPGAITYVVQWQRAFDAAGTGVSDIPGATSWDYTTTTTDHGRFLRVRVTATDDGEADPTTASSEAVSVFVPEPSLSGGGDDGSASNRCGNGSGFSAFALLGLLSLMCLRRQRR